MIRLIAWLKSFFAEKCEICGKQMYRGKCPYKFTSLHKEVEKDG